MDMKKLYEYEAVEIRELVVSGKITAKEVVEETFKRIEETEERLGSFVSLRKEKALEEASKIDEKIKNGEKLGVLCGVPIALKDNMVSYGDLSTSCSKMLEGYEGIYDATVVKKIKEADGIIIGKTNMDEFAMGSSTKSSHIKMTKNPWDESKVPGGSSGGAAASIGGSQVHLSLGSDTGGSIRQPASYCGVVGLKPTYGRVSRYGLMAFGSSLDQIGPLGKTVTDVATCLNVIAGPDEFDGTVENKEVEDYTKDLGMDLKELKIGVPKEYFIDGLDESVRKVIDDVIEKCREKGAQIKEISLPNTRYAVSTYYILAPAEASSNLSRYDGIRYGHQSDTYEDIDSMFINSRSEGFGDEVKRRIMIGTYVLSAGFYDAYYKKAQQVRRLIKEDFIRAYKEVDVIFTPTAPGVAFDLKAEKSPIELYLEDIFTIPANLSGIPGISLPVGSVDGLPVGLQILGDMFCEKKILDVAKEVENLRGPWVLPEIK